MNTFPVYVLDDEDVVPLPGGEVHIDIPLGKVDHFRSAGTGSQKVVVVACTQGHNWDVMLDAQSVAETAQQVAMLCVVERKEDSPDFQLITLVGERRVHVLGWTQVANGTDAEIQPVLEEFSADEEQLAADIEANVATIFKHTGVFDTSLLTALKKAKQPEAQMDTLAHYMLKHRSARIAFLMQEDPELRWDTVQDAIGAYLVEKRVSKRAKPEVPGVRLEPVKPKVAREAWGARLALLTKIPKEHEERLRTEIGRWEALPDNANEKHALSTYLDWALSIPWGETSYAEKPLKDLKSQLDATHYGLDDVKNHVVEHMVIERRCGGTSGTVLCFTGPPGTGKTSIAKSIAEATGRKLIRIALGGLSDEAEIRGHRRTYVAAKPGRIVDGLRKAGCMDPLILLDEVDKIARFKGDPMAALLEVLDPEQNNQFVDRFLELPIDLSKAMFICTANEEEDIHPALLDRMEFLRFKAYPPEERQKITEEHLIPELMTKYHITSEEVIFTPDAVTTIIGIEQLRQIEKLVGRLLRRAAVLLDVEGQNTVTVDSAFVKELQPQQPTKTSPVGFGRERKT